MKGTPLKNGKDSERIVNISSEFATAIKEYLDSPDYHDVTDQFGRQPLLTTESGRIDESTLRRDFYKVSRPCVYGDSCPHDRNSSKCKATTSKNAYKCPSSYSPHPFRRWSIETQIEKGIPKDRLSDRVDVSVKVLDKHYDQRSEERKSQERLKFLERVFEDFGDANATLQPAELSMLTDEQGDIDPELLAQFTARADDGNKSQESNDSNDNDQLQLDDFEYQLTGPALLFILNLVRVHEWISRRLAKEMKAMSPRIETPFPTKRKAVKAVAGYWLFTMLLSLNLILAFPEQFSAV